MKQAMMLAAGMVIAACAGRNEGQVGAAPENGDDPATHAIDTTRTGPPGTGGRPGNATVTVDSVIDDTANVVADTSYDAAGTSPISTPQDTLGPGTLEPDMGTDTTAGDTTGYR